MIRKQISEFLIRQGIEFEPFSHKPITTCEEGLEIAANLGSTCCKNLLLKNKKQFFLFVLDGKSRFNAKEASKFLNCGHLSFASTEELEALMKTYPGAVSLLGLIFDVENRIQVVIEKHLLDSCYVDCHPCNNAESWKIPANKVFGAFLEVLNKKPIVWEKGYLQGSST